MKDSQAAMIVYDVTSSESMKALEDWINEYENKNPSDFIISIVGNKVYLFLLFKLISSNILKTIIF